VSSGTVLESARSATAGSTVAARRAGTTAADAQLRRRRHAINTSTPQRVIQRAPE
jgi:hypothetical protein